MQLSLVREVCVVLIVVGRGIAGSMVGGLLRRRLLRGAGVFEHVSRARLQLVDGCC
jgi:hypothetical protein